MTWKSAVSALLLVVLASLPVSGAVCAMLCGTGATTTESSAHHACEQAAATPDAASLQATSAHDCGAHDLAQLQASVAAPDRADAAFAVVILTPAARSSSALSPARVQAPAHHSPPGTAPPTSRPLVLRV